MNDNNDDEVFREAIEACARLIESETDADKVKQLRRDMQKLQRHLSGKGFRIVAVT